MKHLLPIFICWACMTGVLFTACAPKQASEETEQTETLVTEENSDPVQSLNTEAFIRKVHDFRQNDTWNYKGERPCVIDFYADWCPPCKMMAPVMEKLANQYKGEIDFYRVNVDECEEVASHFEIQSIPFFLLCPIKGEPSEAIGSMSEESFKALIETLR